MLNRDKEILEELKSSSISQADLARKYKISRVRIHQIVSKFKKSGLITEYKKPVKPEKPTKIQRLSETTKTIIKILEEHKLKTTLIKRKKSDYASSRMIDVEGRVCFITKPNSIVFFPSENNLTGYYRFRKPKKESDYVMATTPRGIFVIPYHIFDKDEPQFYISEKQSKRFDNYLNNFEQLK